MDEVTEVVVPRPRMTVGQLWNELSCYGMDRAVTMSFDGLHIDHRDVIPVPFEHLCGKE